MKSVVRILMLAGTLPWLLLGVACAEPGDLARYDLSFCGYRVGMSYDEAAEIRPIQRVDLEASFKSDRPILIGYVDNLLIEEIDLRFKLHFNQERLFKVIARLPPTQFEELQRIFVAAYGMPEDRSRNFEAYDGSTRSTTAYRWDFPGAQIFLLQASTNTEFATAGLMARPDKKSAEPPAAN